MSEKFKEILDAVKESSDKLHIKLDTVKSELTTQMNNFIQQMNLRMDQQDKKINEIEVKYTETKEQLETCKSKLQRAEEKIHAIEERVITNEAHNRRLNLIFSNVPESDKEDVKQKIDNIMITNLKIPADKVERFLIRDIHRLGKVRSNQDNSTVRHRPIIIAFICQMDRNLVYSCAKNLYGSEISIKVDLPMEWNKIREHLLVQRKAIKEHNRNTIAVLKYKSYRPVLEVKCSGKMVIYNENMDLNSLQEFDVGSVRGGR